MEELEKVVFDAAIERVKKLSFGVFEVFVSFEVDPLVGRDVLRCHPKRHYGKRRSHEEEKSQEDKAEEHWPGGLDADSEVVGKIKRHQAAERHRRREYDELGPVIVSDAVVDVGAVMIKFPDAPIAYFAVFRSNWTDEATRVA